MSRVSSAWQSPFLRVSLAKKEWTITHPAPDRILLTHKSNQFTVLVTEYGSSLSPTEANLYLNKDFKADAIRNRSSVLSLDSSNLQNVEASVSQFDGQLYGSTTMELPTPQGDVHFTERIWVEEERAWQISVAAEGPAHSNSKQAERILDEVMASVMNRNRQTASHVFPTTGPANAAALDQEAASALGRAANIATVEPYKMRAIADRRPASETARAIHGAGAREASQSSSWFPAPSEKECAETEIDDAKRGTAPHGVKFLRGSVSSCLVGGEDAIKKWAGGIKQAFISGIESVSQHAEENLRKHPCAMPERPSGVLQWMGYSSKMESYNACLSSAGTVAVIQAGRDLVVTTAQGIGALINYIRSMDDPVALVTAYLQKEAKGFMCLNADAQAAVMCEALTHIAGAFLGTAVTAGAGAAITAGSEVALAARGALALHAGLKAAKDLMLAPVTVPVAAARVAIRAPIVAKEIATAGVRGITERVAAAQAIRQATKTDFDEVLTRLASNDGKLDEFKKAFAAEKGATGEDARLLDGRIDAANKKLNEIRKAYGPMLAQETGEKAKTISLISTAETMGISRAKIETALKDGLQCKIP